MNIKTMVCIIAFATQCTPHALWGMPPEEIRQEEANHKREMREAEKTMFAAKERMNSTRNKICGATDQEMRTRAQYESLVTYQEYRNAEQRHGAAFLEHKRLKKIGEHNRRATALKKMRQDCEACSQPSGKIEKSI